MSNDIAITACYAFFPIAESDVKGLHEELLAFGKERGMKGLVLLAAEGINATVCGTSTAIVEWKDRMIALHDDILFKDSASDKSVFRRWSVKIRPEIVAIKQADIHPAGEHRHLSPEEWHTLQAKEDVVVLDARNSYEIAIGKFCGAIDPGIRHFRDFPAYLKKTDLPRHKKVMLYCTGGIRCEKAIIAMEKEGFSDVVQLKGGILAYLEKFPHAHFEGECFVFDQRVAVDQTLQPSKIFTLCTRCGDPTSEPVCNVCRAS
ncbi:hypothetical protein A3D88_04650 [Candidatus Peribacteria bacterium RIFCSPHIGHO2_02_FULL_52_16]|nr:MAG: hypothetical protein A2706_03280 [Candidatus Peribacteria bacterium RIFCSPHIGHO2_01_FULL_51_35]OGJ60893.1 MAG: hypothetical protein A3D88_04650 [Candidatus Peribacteria bacterium RIFCSPHIGHO2_02_FULL_52_16]